MLRKSLSLLTAIWLTVFLGATAGFAAPPPDKGGGKGGGGGGGSGGDAYIVEMHDLTQLFRGILTSHYDSLSGLNYSDRREIPSCKEKGMPESWSVRAERQKVTKDLSILHANGPDVVLDLVGTGISWSRKYPVADAGLFDGCFGATQYDNGHLQLIIDHPKQPNKPHFMRFVWDFEFYRDDNVVEHFTLTSERIELQTVDPYTYNRIASRWDPDSSDVNLIAGVFDIDYSLAVNGETVADHESLTNGEGVYLEFWLHTCGLQSCL